MRFLDRHEKKEENIGEEMAKKALNEFNKSAIERLNKKKQTKNSITLQDITDGKLQDCYDDSKEFGYDDFVEVKKEIVRRFLNGSSLFREYIEDILKDDYIKEDED
ncbi:MAG: hypothetical protein ISP01_05345 [Methanobrevibacter arboriphilus]|uniref:Uncharacterized protein n=1 Tax=Methanobrevibacter arboriphilus TaxID=39441 RepID=A0A843AFY7_METAZ|nr:hypothetical protein [Methanobrevibacter arboriphilus]MBF4468813.1 hypothetical protein [Methanobrevibacter arboriphilus]